MIIRLVTPSALLKVKASNTDSLYDLISQKISQTEFTASLEQNSSELLDLKKTPHQLNIQNGAFIYVNYEQTTRVDESRSKHIERSLTQFCDHSSNAICSNCAPLDVWDFEYHKLNKIKYISYEAHLEMLTKLKKTDEKIDYDKIICKDHGSNVKCAKCLDYGVPLKQQTFRMIDHVEFASEKIIENFVANCRATGKERFGILFGREMNYDHVPLGKKVCVYWIYEPAQENFDDGFTLCDSEIDQIFTINQEAPKKGNKLGNKISNDFSKEGADSRIARNQHSSREESREQNGSHDDFDDFSDDIVEIKSKNVDNPREEQRVSRIEALKTISDKMNLKVVGIIYSDYSERPCIVNCLEIQFIAEMQLRARYFCKQTNTECNSKLVTVICQKNDDNYTSTEFAVSEQCMELIKKKMIAPTEDPGRMKVLDNAPELFYCDKNEYGGVVKQSKNEYIPIEYFLVSLTHGHKENPLFTSKKFFNIDFTQRKIAKYFENMYSLENFSNMNFLIKALSEGLFPNQISALIDIVHTNDSARFESFLESEDFVKFRKTLAPFDMSDWACKTCTFFNTGARRVCEMCETVR